MKKGFTLVELLIAVTILAVISIIGYQALDAMINSQRSFKLKDRKLSMLQKSFNQWQSDCMNIEKQPIKDVSNNIQVTMNQGKVISVFLIKRILIDNVSNWQLISYNHYKKDLIRLTFEPTNDNNTLNKQISELIKIDLEKDNNALKLLPINGFVVKVWQNSAWQDYIFANPQISIKGMQLNLDLTKDWEDIGLKQKFSCLINF